MRLAQKGQDTDERKMGQRRQIKAFQRANILQARICRILTAFVLSVLISNYNKCEMGFICLIDALLILAEPHYYTLAD